MGKYIEQTEEGLIEVKTKRLIISPLDSVVRQKEDDLKIEFYHKNNNEAISAINSKDYLFVMNDEVYRNNCEIWEGQAGSIGFEDCIERRTDIGWRVVD